MPRKKGKTVSFDVMVKFFLRHYNIPTKKDVEKLSDRLDRMEQRLIKMMQTAQVKRVGAPKGRPPRGKSGKTASDTVLEFIRKYKDGARFTEVRDKTGFEEKKLRNIIFRLNDIGKIKRISRGVYVAVPDKEGGKK